MPTRVLPPVHFQKRRLDAGVHSDRLDAVGVSKRSDHHCHRHPRRSVWIRFVLANLSKLFHHFHETPTFPGTFPRPTLPKYAWIIHHYIYRCYHYFDSQRLICFYNWCSLIIFVIAWNVARILECDID